MRRTLQARSWPTLGRGSAARRVAVLLALAAAAWTPARAAPGADAEACRLHQELPAGSSAPDRALRHLLDGYCALGDWTPSWPPSGGPDEGLGRDEAPLEVRLREHRPLRKLLLRRFDPGVEGAGTEPRLSADTSMKLVRQVTRLLLDDVVSLVYLGRYREAWSVVRRTYRMLRLVGQGRWGSLIERMVSIGATKDVDQALSWLLDQRLVPPSYFPTLARLLRLSLDREVHVNVAVAQEFELLAGWLDEGFPEGIDYGDAHVPTRSELDQARRDWLRRGPSSETPARFDALPNFQAAVVRYGEHLERRTRLWVRLAYTERFPPLPRVDLEDEDPPFRPSWLDRETP